MNDQSKISWREHARRKIRDDLYLQRTFPAYLFQEGYEPLDKTSRRELNAEVLVDVWDEMVDIINREDGYRAARTLEEGLEKRLRELRSQLRRFEREYYYYQLQQELIEDDVREFGGDTSLQQALEENTEEMNRRGWTWTYERSTFHASQTDDAATPQRIVQHRVPEEKMRRFLIRVDDDVDESYVPNSGPLTFSSDMKFSSAADISGWPVGSVMETLRKTRRTCDLIRFRSAILNNVLFQYEATGTVQKITPEDAKGLLDDEKEGRHSQSWKNKWKRRRINVCLILLLSSEGELIRNPNWEKQLPSALFQELAEREPNLSGDKPHKSLRRYFSNRLEDRFPGGGDLDGWFELAELWSQDLPINIFDEAEGKK